ncbi:globin domain-containing protein [Streptomyces sp. NPDC056716]|uniref:globin domain-containing protein n=1 Tax=unclassified Streptomyces TaxID=2593676 RepID=UPI0036C2CEED
MFEARHSMDAPTTTSADNGTSGGAGGWFKPRKEPAPAPGGEPKAAEGRRLAGLRTVRKPPTSADAQPSGGEPDSAPTEAAPDAYVPRDGSTNVPTDGPGDAPADRAAGAHTDDEAADAAADAEGGPGESAADAERIPDGAMADSPETATPGAPSPSGASPSGAFPSSPAPGTAAAATVAPSTASLNTASLTAAPAITHPPVPSLAKRVPAQRPAPTATTERPGPPQSVPQPHPQPTPTPASQSVPSVPPETLARLSAQPGSPDALLIRRTMAEIGPVADKVTSYFYALLFVRHPDLRQLFPAAMDAQRDRLLRALLTAAEHLDDRAVLVDYLQNLGRGHRKYGTKAEHYPAVGECLIGALSRHAAAVWDNETEAAWVRAYTTISQVMIDAAAVDELRAPAWWQAEVVSHELRTPGIAVLTVRPDQPYPFLAGQYASLETPWWPRVWRHYSFASAPRSDGLLTFHVKAIPAGWVSNALVHRARPGDVVRLGPPAGSMTVDHTSDSGLLCLGGGTGIAPIKALVEDVAEHGERRPVEVFYGARTDHDLYDIDTMLRLQQSHPWLSVRAIIEEQANIQLTDVLREYGPWMEYDAYLSGPPGMIRSGVNTLRDIGVPSDRIRHDSVEELVAAGT